MEKPQEFKCVFCKETFNNKEELQIHFRKHGDPKFHPSMKQKLRSPNSQSEKSDDGIEMVNCDVCSEVFPTISKAITHKHKVHPDHDAKYFCPWCGKLFTMKHLYNKHLKANHVGMDDNESSGFHCDCCEVTFHVPSAMLYHNKFFHQKDFELPSAGHSKKLKMINQEAVQIYYCPFCGEEYNNKINLNKHMGDDHSDENQSPDDVLRCPLCDAIFYHLDAYELHLTFHSIEDTYSEKNDMVDAVTEFSLETVPPIMERVESCEPNVSSEAMGIEDFLQIAMDTSVDDESVKVKSKKHKKHKKSKKAAITLDEFLNMNTDVFGEGLDFQGIEEVPSRVVAKRLKVKKQPELTKTGKKVMSRKELEKLRKQGIVVKMKSTKNPATVKKGATSKQIKLSDDSKLLKQTKSNIVSTSDDVLSKLLNQSNQIKIVRKTTQDKLDTEHSMSDDEQQLLTSDNVKVESKCDVRESETPTESDIEDKINHSRESQDENFSKVGNDEFTSNVKNIEGNLSPNNDAVHKDIYDKLPSNGTLSNSKLVSHPNIHLKNTDIQPNNQTADLSETGTKNITNSLSALRNIRQHLIVKALPSPKNEMKSPSYEDSYDKEDLQKIEGKIEMKETEHVKSITELTQNCFKEKPNALKHLSHLTVKSVSQTKNTTPAAVNKETDHDIDLPIGSQSELEHEDNSDTETQSKCINFISKKINKQDSNESSVKSIDALKNISKNITIKSLAQPTHSSQSNICKFEDNEDDYIDEKFSAVINKRDKEVFQNKSHPISKVQTSERIAPVKISSPMRSPSLSPKVTNTSGHGKLISKEVVPCADEITRVQPNNTDLLKHLTNITAKPIGNLRNTQISVNKSTTQSFSMQKNLEQKQVTKNEEIKQDIEIFNIDDSDSDNEENKPAFTQATCKTEILPKNSSQSIDALKNLSKHITIKGTNQQMMQSTKNTRQDLKEKFQDNYEFPNNDDYDEDYSERSEKKKVTNINSMQKNQVLQNTLKNLSRHITIKSQNSSPNSVVAAQDYNTQNSYDRLNTNDGSDSDSNPGRVKITEINEDHKPTEMYQDPNEHMNENVLIQSPHESGSEIDDFFNEDADEDFTDVEQKIKTNTLTKLSPILKPDNDKFKNISKDITIKSLNEKKSESELPVPARGTTSLPSNICNELSIKPFKVCQEKNETIPNRSNKIIGQQIMRPPNQVINQKVSGSSNQMNTINKEVTVKTFQTKTVIQEITTTVTKTIKTVNQTVKQEIQSSGQSSTPVIPQKVQGMRQTQPLNKNYQGVVVRHASPMMGAKVRNAMTPVRPGPPKNCNQIVPIRPGLTVTRPNNPRLPLTKSAMPSTSGVNISGKSIKMSPNSKTTTQNKRPNLQEPSGPFSCFKKPKESLIPVSDIPNLNNSEGGESTIYFASSSQMSKSNIMNMTKMVKGNSVVSSTQVKSEVSTSSQQLSKLNNMSGLKVVRTSQVKQAVEEKQEVSAAKRTALEAIEKLQKQGLLVKKPRADMSDDSEHSNVDDEVGNFSEENYDYDE